MTQARRYRCAWFPAFVLALTLLSCVGKHVSTLYQTSSIQGLLRGDYRSGKATVGQLKRLGNYGLGTFVNYQGGEMLMLGQEMYSIPHPQGASLVTDAAIDSPFAMVTAFHPDKKIRVQDVTDYASLRKLLDAYLDPQKNYAILIEGALDGLKVQCAQPPHRPGLPFAEIQQDQAEFQNVSARLFGFRMSEQAEAVNLSGYHFHGLTRKGQGGHVLEMKIKDATVRWQEEGTIELLQK